MRNIDITKVKNIIIDSIKRKFSETNKRTAVLGLSGGLDSTTLAFLLKKSLGRERVLAVLMPELEGDQSTRLPEEIGIDYKVLPVNDIVSTDKLDKFCSDKMAKGNLIARSRMMILYYAANCLDGLVVGTSNKSELYTGYFTKFGDGASDFRPMAGLYKTEVEKLAKELGVPGRVIDKKPSAGFWDGQTDEDELGIHYDELDEILYSYIDLNLSESELKNKFNEEKVERVLYLVRSTEHKRGKPEKVSIGEK